MEAKSHTVGHTGQATEKHHPIDEHAGHSQRNLIAFDELTFDSRFECGNLMHVDQAGKSEYALWIAPDCFKSHCETTHLVWFYFKVTKVNLEGKPSKTITFKVMNVNRHEYNSYKSGMVPVCCGHSTNNVWQYIPTPLKGYKLHKDSLEIQFEYEFSEHDSHHGVSFAFTFPYTYSDCDKFLDHLGAHLGKDPHYFFQREVLAHSLEGRKIELLTITGKDHHAKDAHVELEPTLPHLFPEGGTRPPKFKHKKYIFLSCRVHPCETPASFMLQGFLHSLEKKDDPVTQALLKNFVFVIIPMLNPDGVVRGHYRTDTKGRDLNRTYHQALANPEEYPGPYSVMAVAKSLADGRLVMYLDLHAHSNKDSGFVFSNYTPEVENRAETQLFARMFDMYSKTFDYTCCGFGRPVKTENLNPSHMGIGKTEVGKHAGIFHCYTLECSYHKKTKDCERYTNNPGKDMKRKIPARIGPEDFFEIGDALRHALLETFDHHPSSFVAQTWYKSAENTKKKIVEKLLKEPPPEPKDEEDEDEYSG